MDDTKVIETNDFKMDGMTVFIDGKDIGPYVKMSLTCDVNIDGPRVIRITRFVCRNGSYVIEGNEILKEEILIKVLPAFEDVKRIG